jgi:hypothetical protein
MSFLRISEPANSVTWQRPRIKYQSDFSRRNDGLGWVGLEPTTNALKGRWQKIANLLIFQRFTVSEKSLYHNCSTDFRGKASEKREQRPIWALLSSSTDLTGKSSATGSVPAFSAPAESRTGSGIGYPASVAGCARLPVAHPALLSAAFQNRPRRYANPADPGKLVPALH